MRKKIFIGIGISGGGKSTFFHTFCERALYLNADSIRKELSGDASDQSVSKEAFRLLYQRLTEAMYAECDIVVDNTSLTTKTRKMIIDLVDRSEREIVLVWFSPDLEKSQQWNTQRDRQVPGHVIQAQYDKMEYPSEYEQSICTVYGVSI